MFHGNALSRPESSQSAGGQLLLPLSSTVSTWPPVLKEMQSLYSPRLLGVPLKLAGLSILKPSACRCMTFRLCARYCCQDLSLRQAKQAVERVHKATSVALALVAKQIPWEPGSDLMHRTACEEAQCHLGHAQGLGTHIMPPSVQVPMVKWMSLGLPSWKELYRKDSVISPWLGALQDEKTVSKAAAK